MVEANVAKKLVVEARPAAKSVVVAFTAERLVVDAFTAVRLPMNPLVNVSPVPVVLVVDALVMYELIE